jgi:hypothetical protein
VTTATVRRARLAPLLAAALALAGPARAQDVAPGAVEDPRAARFADVERGLSIGFEAGGLGLTRTPTSDKAKFPFTGDGGTSRGVVVALTLGLDLGSRATVSLFGAGTNQRAGASYGAFDLLAAGLDLRWAFLGQKDRNDWERFFVYAHARGGLATSHPRGLFGTSETLLGAGLGVEYYTQLRHFSVGLQLDGLYALQAKAPGYALTPTVRYTF